jgi:hypothetical protein
MANGRFFGRNILQRKQTFFHNPFFLVYMTIMMILFVIIQPTYEIYVDCQARCMLASKRERNQDTLQMCRDECELLDLLEQEDTREGKHYKYRQY